MMERNQKSKIFKIFIVIGIIIVAVSGVLWFFSHNLWEEGNPSVYIFEVNEKTAISGYVSHLTDQ